jgi:hypothetical protein
MNYFYLEIEAARAEDSIPSMSYVQLLDNLVRFAELGVLAPDNPASMLVVARLGDRARFRRSGLTFDQLSAAVERYRRSVHADPSVAKAIELAIAPLRP